MTDFTKRFRYFAQVEDILISYIITVRNASALYSFYERYFSNDD